MYEPIPMYEELLHERLEEEVRCDISYKTDDEILADELRNCGHMSELAWGLLMSIEDRRTL